MKIDKVFGISLGVLFFFASILPVFANPRILYLPFTDLEVFLKEGWIYGSGGNHKGIDYFKGQSGNWQSFEIRATAYGIATYLPNGSQSWGSYVKIDHQTGSPPYYTVYAHLASSTLPANTPTTVNEGDLIGFAGATGKTDPPGTVHLHLEWSRGGIGGEPGAVKLDPYDINQTYLFYPGYSNFNGCGPDYAWTECPPVPPGIDLSQITLPFTYDGIEYEHFFRGNQFEHGGGINWFVFFNITDKNTTPQNANGEFGPITDFLGTSIINNIVQARMRTSFGATAFDGVTMICSDSTYTNCPNTPNTSGQDDRYVSFYSPSFLSDLPVIDFFNNLPVIPVSGNITENTTWEAGYVYLVQGSVTVNQGVILTLEPGVIVKFQNIYSKLNIYGTLSANGQIDQKIYFTSYKDDDKGGDSNGDGNATNPAPQDWQNIIVHSGGSADLSHAVVRYGGYRFCQYGGCNGDYGGIKVEGGNLNVSNSLIEKNNNGIHFNNATSTSNISYTTIDDNGDVGISITGHKSNLNLHVFGSTISNNSTYGIYVIPSGGSPTVDLSLVNNHFLNNQLHDGWFYAYHLASNSGNTTTGTGGNGFSVSGTLNNNQILNPGVPYIVDYLSLPTDRTLTVNPGVVFKLRGTVSRFDIYGALNASGTPLNKIYFTSYKDDDVGGDSNGDGDTSTSTPKDWLAIYVRDGGSVNFSNTVVRYAGQSWAYCGSECGAGLKVNGGDLFLNNSIITKSEYGIWRTSGTVNVSQSSIKENTSYGIYHTGTGSSTIATNNWWGHISGPYNPAQNPNGLGNGVSNNVEFIPWLLREPNIVFSIRQ